MKVCSRCKTKKSFNDFYKGKAECKRCKLNRHKVWVSKNQAKIKAYRNKHKIKNKIGERKRNLARCYNLKPEDYERLFSAQNGVCAICKQAETTLNRRLSVDHNHKTNVIRGLLCGKCNLSIGGLSENVEHFTAARSYILSEIDCNKTKLIGIGYKARQGKDTLANLLQKQLDGSRIYNFANALKAFARVSKLMTIKDGGLLQILGTDVFRYSDPDIWVRCLALQIKEEAPKVAIISDLRFPNEKQWVERYGKSICVRRLNMDESPYFAEDRPANHPSEIGLDGATFDYEFTALSGDMNSFTNYAEFLAKDCL